MLWEGLSERLKVIKEAKGLLYCDGLVSSRLVGKVGLGLKLLRLCSSQASQETEALLL